MTYKYDESSPSCLTRAGANAGWQDPRGYWKATAKCLYVHRMIWEMLKGPIPDGMMIDHINRDKSDNRIVNLRCVDCSTNNANVGVRSHCKSGEKYIQQRRGSSSFVVVYKGKHYGRFPTLDEAITARNELMKNR